MNPIFKGLDEGYSPDEILSYLSKAIPQFLSPIRKAKSAGYTAQQVLGFLSKTMDTNNRPGISESEIHGANRKSDAALAKHGLTIAGATLAAPAVAAGARSALSRALPQSLTGLVDQQASAHGNANNPSYPQQQAFPQQPTSQPTSQSPVNLQQSSSQTPPVNPVTNIVPEEKQIKQAEEKILQNAQELERQNAQELERQDALKKFKEKQSTAQREQERFEKEYGAQEETQKINTEEKKFEISKKETVATPKGIGEVREIRNGKALVDVDGKLHKIDVDDIEKEPEEISELYDKLFQAIPDEHKSRMMNFAGYDEEHNELLFRPHGGGAYVYKDIPKQFADELKSRLHKAKTTGSNMYGMWTEGDQSYGAGMSKLIKELQAQYGGKGKEYVRKYATLFDILGVPHEAKKRKEQEERRKRKGIS